MKITEVRITLAHGDADPKHRAWASFTIDGMFCVHDVRIIETRNGLIVAMPSRKTSRHCQQCHYKVPYLDEFCGRCGMRLERQPAPTNDRGGRMAFVDVAFPISHECRTMIAAAVLDAYRDEVERAKRDGQRIAEAI